MKEGDALNLPKGWEMKQWSEVLEIRSGRNQKEVLNPNGKYPILGSAGKVMGYADDYICEEETTIIGRKGTINSPLFITEKFWNVDTAFGLQAKDELDKNYLHYFCLSFDFTEMDRGSGRPSLVKSDLLKIEIPIPPLPEQKQIVAILDIAFAAIDQAKANIEKNIENAKELFQSKLNEIFSHPSTSSGQDGDGWEEKRLQDVSIEFGRGKSKHRPRNDKKLFGGKYPFVQTGDIRNADKIVLSYNQTYNEVGLAQSKLWPKGTICITIAANIAETAITSFESCFPDSIIGVVVDSEKAKVNFTYYALQYLKSELQAKGKGSAQDNINMGTFKDQFFPFPSIEEQQRIVNSLDKLKNETIKIESHYQQKLNNLEDFKKSILQKAFSGELTSPKGTQYEKEVRSASDKDGDIPSANKTPERVKY